MVFRSISYTSFSRFRAALLATPVVVLTLTITSCGGESDLPNEVPARTQSPAVTKTPEATSTQVDPVPAEVTVPSSNLPKIGESFRWKDADITVQEVNCSTEDDYLWCWISVVDPTGAALIGYKNPYLTLTDGEVVSPEDGQDAEWNDLNEQVIDYLYIINPEDKAKMDFITFMDYDDMTIEDGVSASLS